jgi:hypothetical protein
VETRRANIPSSKFPDLWQEGFIDGYFYRVFVNGDGLLQSSRRIPDWQITITCDEASKICSRAVDGFVPPQQAFETAAKIENCLVGSKESETTSSQVTKTAEQTGKADGPELSSQQYCASETSAKEPEGVTVQKLLTLAGADPGPIDGFPGKRTRAAIVNLFGEEGQKMTIATAISKLKQMVCGN